MIRFPASIAVPRRLMEWLFLLSSLLGIGGTLAYLHLAETARLEAAERERLATMTTLLAKNIEVDLAATNLALAGVIRDFLSPAAQAAGQLALPWRLNAVVDAMPGVRTMLVLDAAGKSLNASSPELIGLDFSRRAYFQTVRDAPDPQTLYISAPFRSLRSDLVITAARMVTDRQGKFAGVVLATLDPEYFTGKFRTAMYASDVWAVVLHGEGKQFLNYPAKGGPNGASLDVPGSFYRRYRDSAQPADVLAGVRIAGAAASETRAMAMASIAPVALHMDYPIIIGLSREEAAITAPLQRMAFGYALCFAVLALAGASLLYWSQRRRSHQAVWLAAQDAERQSMQALADSETRFRTLIEDAPLAIAMLRHGRFIYSNARYRHLHGYAIEDDLNDLPWRAMIAAESQAALTANEALIDADSTTEQSFEAVALAKHGRHVPVFKTTTRVLLKDGPATLIFVQDISAQKRAEAEMLLARDVAEAANRGKAEFLANMSHEIRSPLNAILGMAWLLERGSLDSQGLQMVRSIRASGQSLLGIVNDILDISKIEAGHMSIEQAPFRLADVIGKVAAAMCVAVHERPIDVRIGPLPHGVDTVLGDALRLEQILTNLTSNALKFTARGVVELKTTLASRNGDEAVVHFSVRDTGIGIAPEVQETIFSPFTQADSSTTRHFGGTGLGLAICRQLVQLMNGTLSLESSVGSGSEFCFAIPLRLIDETPPEAPADEYPGPPVAGTGGHEPPPRRMLDGLRVLVVDDSDVNRDVVCRILLDQGALPTCACDGRQALNWLMAHPEEVDIVLMDVQMPVMDGLQATRELRKQPQLAHLPVVALTAGAFQSQQAAALEAGVNHFIGKPFNVPQTIALLAHVQSQRMRGRAISPLHAPAAPGSQAPVLDFAQGLALWLDETPYRLHLSRFAGVYRGAAAELRTMLAAGAQTDAAAFAHKLCGVAGSLALTATHHAAKHVEHLLRTGADIADALQRLDLELALAIDALDAMPAMLPSHGERGPDGLLLPAAALLERLLLALDSDDPAPAELLLLELEQVVPDAALDPIRGHLSVFDFRGAERATRKLANDLTSGVSA